MTMMMIDDELLNWLTKKNKDFYQVTLILKTRVSLGRVYQN